MVPPDTLANFTRPGRTSYTVLQSADSPAKTPALALDFGREPSTDRGVGLPMIEA